MTSGNGAVRPARAQTPGRDDEIARQFHAAADLSAEQQRTFLDALATGDPELAREVESLLEHDVPADPVLDRPIPAQVLRELMGAGAIETGPGSDAPLSLSRSIPATGGFGSERRDVAPEAGTVIAGRYRIEDVLGSGGGGTVCRARDLQKGIDVAVKFLRSERLQSERGLRRFRREFRAVARLDHPGCVQAFAEGVEGDRRYIVMEYVGGSDLDSLVGAPTARVLAVLVQVAVALDYVHSRRIVHRDLKPANILLVPGDPPAPRIADFGIALLDDEPSWQTEAGGLIGTVDYLSPEQVAGTPADPRSDLYALGCMIFRLWAGRPPFVGSSWERLNARCREAAPRLRELAPAVPEGLDVLAARLLALDPADRPQNALEVAAALARLLVETGSPLASRLLESTSLSAEGAFLYSPGLVGRGAALARMVARGRAISAGAPGEPLFLAVCAEGGIGKTTLCEAAALALAGEGFRTISVSVPSSSAGPLAPFPELRTTLAAAHPPPETPLLRDPRRAMEDGGNGLLLEAETLVTQLRSAHAATPHVVLLEDLHHADRGSTLLLMEIARRLAQVPGPRPVLIATLRPEGRAALRDASASSRDTGPLAGAQIAWVDLEPLDAADTAGVAAAMMGVRAAQLPSALVELLLLESDGSPLLLHSALRTLVDAGALRRTGGAWVLDEARTKARVTGQALVDRLSALSPPTRRVLEVAAAVGRRFDAELITAVLAEIDDAVQDALDEALRAGVIRAARSERHRDVFEFDHARLAEVLHESMDDAVQRSCHATLGRILADRRAAPVVLARHHVLAGEPASAAHCLRAAGDEALQQFDHAGAATLFREALSQCGTLSQDEALELLRDSCREGLSDALVVTGPIGEALGLLTALLSASGSRSSPAARTTRARRLRKLGYARMRSGDMTGTIAALEEALVAVDDSLPRSRSVLLVRGVRDALSAAVRHLFSVAPAGPDAAPAIEEAAIVHRELGQFYRWIDLERSLAHHMASARAAERVGSPELRAAAYSWIAMSMAFVSNARASLALERLASRIAQAAGDRVGIARLALLRAGVDLLVRNDFDSGLARFDEGVRLGQTSGDRMLHAWALAWRGWGCAFACRLDAARVDLERAQAVSRDLGIGWLTADAAIALCLVDVAQGNLDAAEKGARDLLGSDMCLALPAIDALATEALGGVAFARGRYREAATVFARARDIYERHHLERGWGYLLELEESDALLCLADEQGASAVPDLSLRIRRNARSYDRRLRRLPLYRGCVEMLHGIADGRAGHHDRARRAFTRALAARGAGTETYVGAWMLWRTAFERRRMGDPVGELLPLLSEADRIFERWKVNGFREWLAGARKIYDI